MLRRILNFKNDDWKLLWFFFTGMIKGFFTFNYRDMIDGYYLLKLHLTHDSKRIQ